MLKQLHAPEGALIIMNAGIASEENLEWLTLNKYNYLVVSRERKRDIDMEKTSMIESAGGHQIHLQRQPGQHEGEVKLACWSEQRAVKDKSINTGFQEKYEQELNKINEGLHKPRTTKNRDPINQRIGRLKEKYKRVSGHYQINLQTNEATGLVTQLTWDYQPPTREQANPPRSL